MFILYMYISIKYIFPIEFIIIVGAPEATIIHIHTNTQYIKFKHIIIV